VTDPSDYPEAWWIEIDDEWLRYYKASAVDWATLNPASGFDPSLAPNTLITAALPPLILPGGTNAALPGEPSRIYDGRVGRESWRTYEGVLARMNAGVKAATGANIPPWALLGSPRPDPHMHVALDYARALSGTVPAAHAAGADVRLVYAVTRPYCGAGDIVTLLDGAGDAPRRVALRVRRAARGALGPVAAALGAREVDLVTFEALLPAGRRFRPRDGARLLKHPTGFLPLEVPAEILLGNRRRGGEMPSEEPDGPLGGSIDELRIDEDRLGRDRVARGLERPGAPFRHQAELGFRALFDPSAAARRTIGPGERSFPIAPGLAGFERGVNRFGALLFGDEEVIGASQQNGALLEVAERGRLGTSPQPHADEAAFYVLPFPATARLRGGLGGERGERIETGGTGAVPAAGYLAIDAGEGQGIGELIPYVKRTGQALLRPLDDRLRGSFRGAFGTAEMPLREGDLAYFFPFRFFDRYAPRVESKDAVFWQMSWTPPGAGQSGGCLFRSIEWDAVRPNGDVEVKVLARVDGAPAWDAEPTNKRGGLFLFDDPTKPNAIDVAGRQIEVRVYFPYKKGAYRRGTWKDAARLDAIRVRYVEPVRVLATEEVGR
jgi:hypothetical protein